ncbi:uncharacterized protein LOC143910503 [Arctopsyche grandis]|uniref:uncharacterized protein LOC143910503 n=1 Tax=Arctopsyche grandis TaxID=121162 RepID=UPI00406D9A85
MSIGKQAYEILTRELKLLRYQKKPKFPILHRMLHDFSIDKKQTQKVYSSLQILLIKIWKEYDDDNKDFSDVKLSIVNFLLSDRISNLILNSIKVTLGDELTDTSLKEVENCILQDFKNFLIRSLSRIIAQLTILQLSKYQLDDLIIVSTVNGRLCAIDLFLGIIVWSFKAGLPLVQSNKTSQSIEYNGKIVRIIPTSGGGLYKLVNKSIPVQMQVSMEQLISMCPCIGDVIFTGNKITFAKNLSLPMGFVNHKSSQKVLENLDKNEDCVPRTPLILKSTIQILHANHQHNLKTKWSMNVTEYDIHLKKDARPEIQNDSDVTSSAISSIVVDPPKGVITRKIGANYSRYNFFWKIELRSSIANVWILENERLQKLDLFSSPHVMPNDSGILPSFFYTCMEDNAYIQESPRIKVQKSNQMNFDKILNIDDDLMQNLGRKFSNGHKYSDIGFYAYFNESSSAIEEKFENLTVKEFNDDVYNSEFVKKFEYNKKLGEGGFGFVFEARHKHDNCTYAIKRIEMKKDEMDQIVREVQAQANLDHNNLVRYHHSWLEEPPLDWDDPLKSEMENDESSLELLQPGSYLTRYESSICSKAYFYIQMQLCKSGNLRDWLNNSKMLEIRKEKTVSYFKQIVSGVEYMHEQGFIHRDLKPENIFFFSDDYIKIGDFGLTTNYIVDSLNNGDINVKLPNKLEHTLDVGTGFYKAPEQKVTKTYNHKVDIWALGIILVEFLSIFKTGVERIKVLEKLHVGTFTQTLIDAFPNEYKLLRLMLSHDPTKRPTTFGIRAHSPINDKNVKERFYFKMPSI